MPLSPQEMNLTVYVRIFTIKGYRLLRYIMESLIKTFHIDIKLLIAQVINFVIVLFILWKFVYRPLLTLMNDRTQRIEKGLTDAKEAQEKLEQTEFEREQKLIKAQKEAQRLISEAKEEAKKQREEMLKNAREDVGRVVMEGKKQLALEKREILKEIKAEVSELVFAVSKKVLGEEIDAKKNNELVKKSLSKLKK